MAAQKKIKKLEDQLKKNKDVMSSAEVKRQEQDIRSRRRKLQFELQESKDDFNMRANEERRKLIRQVIEVVREIGKEEKIDVILSEGVVYASKEADITDKVIARLKSKYSK
jgi:outer membrane protein